MRNRLSFAMALVAMAGLFSLGTACSSDKSSGPSSALYASWNATSFQAMGQDLIVDLGMGMVLTFANDMTYSIDFTNDQIGACNPGPNCNTSGDFSATGSKIVLDPGSVDEVTLNYSINGSTLTLTGSIDGNPVTIKLTRV